MTISSVPVWHDVALQRFGAQPRRRGIGTIGALNDAVAATMRRHPGIRRAATRAKEGLSYLMATLAFVTIVYAIVLLPGLVTD